MRMLSLLGFMIITFLSACDKDEEKAGDQTPPPLPTNIQQKEAIHGGAIISYNVPDVNDLLYVQARYMINGVERRSKATSYENTLEVSGFGEVKAYEVWISSVDKWGNSSEEEVISVTPLIAPADLAYSSLVVQEAFGGVYVSFKNDAKAELIVETLIKDSLGYWQVFDTRVTKKEEEEFIIKQGIEFLDEKQEFKTYILDRWNNVSDTSHNSLKPLFEEIIDFNHVNTSNYADDDDSWPSNTSYFPKFLTDGEKSSSDNGIYHSGKETTWPVSLTVDLGTEIKISSYKLFPRYSFEYKNHGFKTWQLWARNDTPPVTTEASPDFAPASEGWNIGDTYANVDGDAGWTLISQAVTNRPSGPDGPVTSEDVEHARAGEDHMIPLEIATSSAFRYVRVCFQSSYSKSYLSCGELTFFGEYQGEKPE